MKGVPHSHNEIVGITSNESSSDLSEDDAVDLQAAISASLQHKTMLPDE